MIKLKDLLNESIEPLRAHYDYDAYMAGLKTVATVAGAIGNVPLLYRSGNFKSGHRNSAFIKINNEDRKTYRAGENMAARAILKGLKKKFNLEGNIPVFTTPSLEQSKFFGGYHYIFVPSEASTPMFQSEMIRDIHADTKNTGEDDIQAMVDSYTTDVDYNLGHEVLIDTKAYYLMSTDMADSLPRKMQQSLGDIKTYSDIADLAKKEIWITNKRKEANPQYYQD